MKVGFYLNNSRIEGADLRFPEEGNPGVGGTQYLFVATPYYLKKFHSNKITPVIYAHAIEYLPSEIENVQINSVEQAIVKAEQDGCDIFVFRPISEHRKGSFFELLSSSKKMKSIAWAHNTPDIFTLNKLYKNKNLCCFLCVSQEQYDRLRDHPIIYKSECILNGFNINNYAPKKKIDKHGNRVAYIGSLVPAKGFHWLAKAWPIVLDKRPDAKLIVMGSGKLYDRNASMGEWSIAQESYEGKYIRPYLSDSNGNPHPSVNFMGLVGPEKIRIMQNVDVGVVNPSGVSENCPGSALEFQAAGTPVVSSAKRGILDTVIDLKTGLLGNNIKDLAANILVLLNNQKLSFDLGNNGIQFVKNKFAWSQIIDQWSDLLFRLDNGIDVQVSKINQYPNNGLKLYKEKIRKAKYKLGMKRSTIISLHSIVAYTKYIKRNF